MKTRVCIVTPYLADANNGNWRTADRWRRLLARDCNPIVQAAWAPGGEPSDVLVALHARRSAPSIASFRAAHPDKPLIVMLTGTDLYRDIPGDASAMRSLELADALVVLQDDALRFLPKPHRAKAHVIYQSCRLLTPAKRPVTHLKCVAVGHLRDEKSPQTIFDAFDLLPPDLPIRFDHIGAPLDASLARRAHALAKRDPRYRYLGALPHAQTRQAIRRAHLLVHPSRMEGGANVIAEAITSRTAVLASRVSGNIGMLRSGHPGFFRVDDAADLAAKLTRCARAGYLVGRWIRLTDFSRERFAPDTERTAILALVRSLMNKRR
ncbi:MAG: TIGR04348 family glycosyltransferase [Betaproteobacteria bacterium]|nr:TIGR04348 family glycosyltransferase [Betaproteobacteria bacterium]